MKAPRPARAAFIDINIFAEEGFTNGVFITIREIFNRLNKQSIPTAILSVSQSPKKLVGNKQSTPIQRRRIRDVNVNEILLQPQLAENPGLYFDSVKKLISDFEPSVIFINTPAVFFNQTNIDFLETVIDSGAKVVVLLADALFPTPAKHPTQAVDKYYRLFDKVEVIATSRTLIDKFEQEVGIKANFFPNIFTTTESKIEGGTHDHITLVNHHPVKGKEVFDAIATKLPNKKFLVVETWPDVPPFVAAGPNVTFSKFIPDVRDLYRQTKILLIPSVYDEGPARIITEAMINGIPVIAHRIGCLPEVGKDYIFYVDPPKILKTDMVGTVLYPRLEKKSFDQAVDDFIKIINLIDADEQTWKKYSQKAKTYADEYCSAVEKTFMEYVAKWFYN